MPSASLLVVGVAVSLGLTLCSSGTALAKPTTLICDTGQSTDLAPATVELNEAQGAATVNFPPIRNPLTNQTIPEASFGPFPAAFDPHTIVFSGNTGGKNHFSNNLFTNFVINRLTGSLVGSYRDDILGMSGAFHWQCRIAQAQF